MPLFIQLKLNDEEIFKVKEYCIKNKISVKSFLTEIVRNELKNLKIL
jgi:hypothetical protein